MGPGFPRKRERRFWSREKSGFISTPSNLVRIARWGQCKSTMLGGEV